MANLNSQNWGKIPASNSTTPVKQKPKKDNTMTKYKLGRWAAKLNIAVSVASNEKKPWLEQELDILTIPMPLKAANGLSQVGDYHFQILNGNGEIIHGGLIVERKEISDLYGTLMSRSKRDRFNREILRYKEDPRFDTMVIMVEGSATDFIDYVPEVYVCRLDQFPGLGPQRLVEYLEKYYKIKDLEPADVNWTVDGTSIWIEKNGREVSIEQISSDRAELKIDKVLEDTLYIKPLYGKMALYQRKGASEASKIATISKLFAMDIPVMWCDSREKAIKFYKQMIRQWCIINYDKIIPNIEERK